ncbi:MAG: hypothetical protein DRG39_07575, partial [Deltaproteobacteria bacterium]
MKNPFSQSFGSKRMDSIGSRTVFKEPTTGEWEVGSAILGEYKVKGRLGKGGMGIVYLLRNQKTGGRFAVKRAIAKDKRNRENFLSELQAWVDLPENPHIVACRFFRTMGDEVILFSDYVDGGSVKDLIDTGRLYEGGPMESLRRILDIGIQAAWGLHALHNLGYVHQDVKPGNVLITRDGVVKITDFGLIKARARAASTPLSGGKSLFVSYGGMTPVYCSPEQLNRERLTRRTDIWSFGVSLLHLFTGEVTWRSGVVAPEVLEDYLKEEGDPGLPGMPQGVVETLRRCLKQDPKERWKTMLEVADALSEVYQKSFVAYKRMAPAFSMPVSVEHDRRGIHGTKWRDPKYFLEKVMDEGEIERLLSARGGSRKAQAVGDMAAYEEALRLYEEAAKEGVREIEDEIHLLYLNKGLIHEYLGDSPGSLRLFDRAIGIRERLVYKEGRWELADDLAVSYNNKAFALDSLGRPKEAADIRDKAIGIYERLVYKEGRWELADDLARSYNNKGLIHEYLG